jgi:hypothetical protein
MAELVEMKRQGWRGQLELFTDLAGWEALGAGLHQKAEDIEAGLLSECCEGSEGSDGV